MSTAPDPGIGVGLSAEWAAGTLSAVDRDETFDLVPWATSAAAVASLRKGWWGAEIAVPVRWVPDRELGIGGTRISLLGAWEAGLMVRASMLDPGDLGWGSSWTSTRAEASASWSSDQTGVEVAGSLGEDGWGMRAAAGTRLLWDLDLEVGWARVWSETPAGTLEMGVGRRLPLGGLTLRPFVSLGIGDAPGTPSLRIALDMRRSEPVPQPTPPLIDVPPPQAAAVVVAAAPVQPVEQQQQQPAPQPPAEPPAPPTPVTTQSAPVELDPPADKTPTPPPQVQPALDSSAQAATVGRISSFLSKHPEVILMEARVTAPCLADGSADPIGRAAAEDLMGRVSSLGVDAGRISVREMPCSAGTRSVRIEAVVVRAQPVNDAPKQ